MACNKMLACDTQPYYALDSVCNTNRNHALVHALSSLCINVENLMSLLVRVPFFMFEPNLQVITIGECGRLLV
jgi:hypothetical protein